MTRFNPAWLPTTSVACIWLLHKSSCNTLVGTVHRSPLALTGAYIAAEQANTCAAKQLDRTITTCPRLLPSQRKSAFIPERKVELPN
ncbi:hypothetical protein GQ54DRAFT_23048 [Martensiomyces pterosporus]|nr:hypothetical protein GQ54DRAFT_23048 [Martensiomyces pterosporus]